MLRVGWSRTPTALHHRSGRGRRDEAEEEELQYEESESESDKSAHDPGEPLDGYGDVAASGQAVGKLVSTLIGAAVG